MKYASATRTTTAELLHQADQTKNTSQSDLGYRAWMDTTAEVHQGRADKRNRDDRRAKTSDDV